MFFGGNKCCFGTGLNSGVGSIKDEYVPGSFNPWEYIDLRMSMRTETQFTIIQASSVLMNHHLVFSAVPEITLQCHNQDFVRIKASIS